ncbi:MAG: aminoacyl-tRNA hydrolase [Christensenellales bacterium]|jgi:PTH1 family peptidyl-tRNA hydrolase
MLFKRDTYLIIGLGNPGPQYARTRHNVGFMTIDRICGHLGITLNKSGFKARYAKTTYAGKKLIVAQPQTYMNLSGECAALFARYYKLSVERMLFIYDDVDLPPGALRIRKKGSAGTHNGMKSVIGALGSGEAPRIRIGIGSPGHVPIVDYVLGKFSKEEESSVQQALMRAAKAALCFVEQGMEEAMQRYNGGAE